MPFDRLIGFLEAWCNGVTQPADATEIELFNDATGVEPRPELIELWSRFGGESPERGFCLFPLLRAVAREADLVDEALAPLDGMWLLSPLEAVEDLERLESGEAEAGWAPIGADGGGNLVLVDADGGVFLLNHEGPEIEPVEENLAPWLDALNQAIGAGEFVAEHDEFPEARSITWRAAWLYEGFEWSSLEDDDD